MRRFMALLVAAFALSMSLAACSGTPSEDPEIQKHSGVDGSP
jgi:hypothetical protein